MSNNLVKMRRRDTSQEVEVVRRPWPGRERSWSTLLSVSPGATRRLLGRLVRSPRSLHQFSAERSGSWQNGHTTKICTCTCTHTHARTHTHIQGWIKKAAENVTVCYQVEGFHHMCMHGCCPQCLVLHAFAYGRVHWDWELSCTRWIYLSWDSHHHHHTQIWRPQQQHPGSTGVLPGIDGEEQYTCGECVCNLSLGLVSCGSREKWRLARKSGYGQIVPPPF